MGSEEEVGVGEVEWTTGTVKGKTFSWKRTWRETIDFLVSGL